MASLTERLPSEMQGRQEVDPARPAPSIWEAGATAVGQAAGIADRYLTNREQGARQKVLAGELDAKNAAARDYSTAISGINPSLVNTPTGVPGHDNAVASAKSTAPTILNLQTAGQQGTVGPTVVQARAEAIIRQGIAAHPGHEAAYVMALKELGVTSMATKSYENAEAANTDEAKFRVDEEHKIGDYAITKMGVANYYELPAADQFAVRTQAAQNMARDTQIDNNLKQYQILQAQGSLTKDETAEARTQFGQTQAQLFLGKFGAEFTNAYKGLTNFLSDPNLKDPDKDALINRVLTVGIPALRAGFTATVMPHLAAMNPDDRTLVTNQFETNVKNLTDLLTGPTSMVEATNRQMTMITNQLGIDTAKAAPLITRMRGMIGSNALGMLLTNDVLKDFGPQIRAEFQTASQMGDAKGSQHAIDFLKTLNGEADMKGMTPEWIAAHAPLQMKSVLALASNPLAWNGTDKEAHNTLVNAIGNVAAISASATPQWGFSNLLAQTRTLTQKQVFLAIAAGNAPNPEAREKALQDYIPGLTNSYLALSQTSARDPHYQAVYNKSNMKWELKWDGTKVQANGADFSGVPVGKQIALGINPAGVVKPAPGQAVQDQVRYLNLSLDGLTAIGTHGHDAAVKGASPADIRRYYAEGTLPPDSGKGKAGKSGKTPTEVADDMVSHIMKNINHLQSEQGNDVITPKSNNLPAAIETKDGMTAYYDKNPSAKPNYEKYAPVIAQAAAAHGVPEAVAMNVVHTESKFNPNADSGDAHGIGQISYKEAARRGWDLKSMSVNENADKAMAMLAENYKVTGNWQDAASMYLTGRTVAKAGKAADKNGTTAADYVAATVPSNLSSWLPVGSEAGSNSYGYSRY